jgi:hypothetical protein
MTILIIANIDLKSCHVYSYSFILKKRLLLYKTISFRLVSDYFWLQKIFLLGNLIFIFNLNIETETIIEENVNTMSNNRLEANEDESNKVDRPESNRQPIDNEQQVRRRPVTIIKKSSSSAIYESLKDYSYVKKVRPVSGYLMEENSNMIQNFYHSKRVDQNIYQTIVNESQNESKIYVDEIQKDSLYSKIDPNKLIRKEPLAFTDLRQPSYNEAIVNKSYSQLNSPAKLSTITDISSKQEEHETSDTSPYIVSSSGVISTTDEINYNESENEQDYRVSSIIPKIDNIPDSPKSIVLIF